MTLWQKYTHLPPRTRILLGLGTMAYATIALYLSDSAERAFGLEAGEEEKRKLWGVGGVLPLVSVVERGRGGAGAAGARRGEGEGEGEVGGGDVGGD